MNKVLRMFAQAAQEAERGDSKNASRRYRLGTVGLRADGVKVRACNISTMKPHWAAHAEQRVVRKLDVGSTIFVVRILRNGELGNAGPCRICRAVMKSRGVKRCYYSIGGSVGGVFEYGVLVF